MSKPLCFVLMPFGRKPDSTGGPEIDFDRIYNQAIKPAIDEAGLVPIRADMEMSGGIIHKAMYERLLLCDFAVADLTTANANVFYELGVRHACRPLTTITLMASGHPMPFDLNHLRTIPYDLGSNNKFGDEQASILRNQVCGKLKEQLLAIREQHIIDSPVFSLLEPHGYRPPDIARLKTDTFREKLDYAQEMKTRLAEARRQKDAGKLGSIREEMGDLAHIEAGILVDLFLSLRAVEDYEGMLEMHKALPIAVRQTVLIREQLGFALNRLKRSDEALEVLLGVVEERGPSSETCGLIGRVYKDRWQEAQKSGKSAEARGQLQKAIDSYIQGFETDLRDAYPGINAITLLEIQGSSRAIKRKDELLPVVRYAVKRRLEGATPDYWDYATLLELAVLDNNEELALEYMDNALANVREAWEPKTTANNLLMIEEARRERGILQPWLREVIDQLQ